MSDADMLDRYGQIAGQGFSCDATADDGPQG